MEIVRNLGRSVDFRNGRVAAWIAVGYAAVMLIVAASVGVTLLVTEDSFAGVWLFAITFPLSIVVLLAPIPGGLVTFVALVAAGLLQAWILWRVLRGPRRSSGAAGVGEERGG
ncbi:hypothetical protein SMC26_14200 [Actinomadura fulvescens]|uniref:Uncharacterized protein n=1 Tax=Actinomadura fulvescens TaxID=46160 RepID=A0ABN3Q2J6_9ACTN